MSLFFAFLLVALVSFGQGRSIAITIGDLPRGGDGPRDLASVRALTVRLLDALKDLPVTGFVNAGRTQDFGDAELQEILSFWKKQGAELSNHTFSHPDLNRVTLAEFEADLLRGRRRCGRRGAVSNRDISGIRFFTPERTQRRSGRWTLFWRSTITRWLR